MKIKKGMLIKAKLFDVDNIPLDSIVYGIVNSEYWETCSSTDKSKDRFITIYIIKTNNEHLQNIYAPFVIYESDEITELSLEQFVAEIL